MKLLVNGVGAYLTGDEIADAVLSYGVALANAQRVDLVDVPYLDGDDDAHVGSVRLSVGCRVDINAVRARPNGAELVDAVLVAELRARTTALHPPADTPLDPAELSFMALMDEYL